MRNHRFPLLEAEQFSDTRDALHAYARVLGIWLSTCRARRKHWWHASLRISLTGVTTGVIHSDVDFEIELNLRESALSVRTVVGEQMWVDLHGQPAQELADRVRRFLESAGVSERPADISREDRSHGNGRSFTGYLPEEANKLGRALSAVSTALTNFRAGVREETSPIQLWPHHFDVAMLWLPGDKVAGEDPGNEEYADKQMNFGFTFGDDAIPEPYFYVTAYPLPKTFPTEDLPNGTQWQTEGFTGAVLLYQQLGRESDPVAYLQRLWGGLLADGKHHLTHAARQDK